MALRNITIVAELTDEDGAVAARMVLEYKGLDRENVLFIEKHLLIDPLVAINGAASGKLSEPSTPAA